VRRAIPPRRRPIIRTPATTPQAGRQPVTIPPPALMVRPAKASPATHNLDRLPATTAAWVETPKLETKSPGTIAPCMPPRRAIFTGTIKTPAPSNIRAGVGRRHPDPPPPTFPNTTTRRTSAVSGMTITGAAVEAGGDAD